MTAELIAPDELPRWVPGRLTLRSPDAGWAGLAVRGYRYPGSDVEVPPMRDYVVVAYCGGRTRMSRRVERDWVREQLGPGDVSLLTRAAGSHWVWPDGIEVVHVYLGAQQLVATCREMYGRDVAEVALRDEVRADDPTLHGIAMLIAREAAAAGSGCSLLIDALTCQLSVHILRGHARVRFREPGDRAALSPVQERALRDFVQAHLRERIRLDDLAAVAGLSRFQLCRRFRRSLGTSPHEFVLRQRVARAAAMLTRTGASLSEVALACGFADQSHLNRVFKGRLGATPGRFRERQG